MMHLLPILLGPQNADPLAQLRTLLAAPGVLEAKVVVGSITGTLSVANDGSARVVSGSERLIHNGEADWEFDDSERIYDRLPPAGPKLGGRVGTFRLHARTPALLVPLLLTRGKNRLLERRFTREGSAYTAKEGETTIRLEFGKDRSLTRLTIQSPMGGDEWKFTGLRIIPDDPKLFRASVPERYVEAFEPEVPVALGIGSALPERFRSLAPKGTKTWILAVLEPGVISSDKARGWLGRLSSRIPNVILDDANAADRQDLVAPDSPTYLLVRDGKVLGAWLGYVASEETRMEDEMRDAIERAGQDEAGSSD